MISIKTIQVTSLATNCYIIMHNQSNESLIIDPGGDSKTIINLLKKLNSQPLAIIATHAHFDHIMAIDKIKEIYQIPFYLHKKDKKNLENSSTLSQRFISTEFTPPEVDHYYQESKMVSQKIGPFKFKIIHTPGHTPGSICLEFRQPHQNPKKTDIFVYFLTGDTLFANNQVGRTDLPGGSSYDLRLSLQKITNYLDKINPKQKKITLLPGHGPSCIYA